VNRIKLTLFTWAYVQLQDEKILSPICPTHQEAHVHLKPSGNDRVVLCGTEGHHLLNLCSKQEFESEKQDAAKSLSKLLTEN
jgi:hypothetical protein